MARARTEFRSSEPVEILGRHHGPPVIPASKSEKTRYFKGKIVRPAESVSLRTREPD